MSEDKENDQIEGKCEVKQLVMKKETIRGGHSEGPEYLE